MVPYYPLPLILTHCVTSSKSAPPPPPPPFHIFIYCIVKLYYTKSAEIYTCPPIHLKKHK